MRTNFCVQFVVLACFPFAVWGLPVMAAPKGDSVPARAGSPAPPLTIDGLLQAPAGAGADWDSLRGNVVVLEFWSTYCAPCVALIPHLDPLKERLEDKPIRFIAVAPEDEPTVRKFLERRPKKGWIALDPDNSVASAYGIRGLPAMVVVDAKGRLAGWMSPYSLLDRPEILSDLLSGKVPEAVRPTPPERAGGASVLFAEVQRELLEGPDAGEEAPLCLVLIRRAKERKVRLPVAGDSGGMRYDGVTVKEAIEKAFNVAPTQMVLRAPLPEDQKFDVMYRWSGAEPGGGRSLLRQAVASAFGVQVRREVQERDVYVMSLAEGARSEGWDPALSRVKFDSESGLTAPNEEMLARMKAGEKFYWTYGDTEELAFQLGHLLDRPVVDEANVEGYFLFYAPREGDEVNAEALMGALRERYGLVLTPDRREMDVLVVERAGIAPTFQEGK